MLCAYISHREEEILNYRNQAEFKCLKKSIGKPIMSIWLTNSLCDIISDGLNTANALKQKFPSNFLSADVFTPTTSDSLEHEFNAIIHDTYMALHASPNSAAGPDGDTGRLPRQLTLVLSLPLSIVFQQSFMQGCFTRF